MMCVRVGIIAGTVLLAAGAWSQAETASFIVEADRGGAVAARGAVERAGVRARALGARRVLPLPVSAPFHCALMAPAAAAMKRALAEVALAPPAVPLVANVTAAAVSDPETIRRLLVEQVTFMVRWRESVLYMKAQGVATLFELGAGKVLGGLARRIDRDLDAVSVGQPDDVEAALMRLS